MDKSTLDDYRSRSDVKRSLHATNAFLLIMGIVATTASKGGGLSSLR